MLSDQLIQKTNELEEFNKRKTEKLKKSNQKALDEYFKKSIDKTDKFIKLLLLYKQELSYTVDNQYIEDVYDFLSEICDYIEENKIDKEHCRELDKKIETLKNALSDNWNSFYEKYSSNTVGLLKMVSVFNPIQINDCLKKIDSAKVFMQEESKIEDFAKQLKRAESIISNLEMDDEITDFLKNVNSGNATLLDLNENILAWLRKENFEGKIKIGI